MSCHVGCRWGWDPVLVWLWYRLVAVAPNRLLGWEPPYAMGAALKSKINKQTNKQTNEQALPVISKKYKKQIVNYKLLNWEEISILSNPLISHKKKQPSIQGRKKILHLNLHYQKFKK